MKYRFTSLDCRAMVLSLQSTLLGYRVANCYDLNPKTYLIKLAKPDSKVVLLLESGVRLHTTAFERDKGNVPSGFTLKLRKSLKGKRIERVAQLGSDRIIVLTFGTGEWENSLVVELYDKGNVLLLDPSHNILTLLRNSKYDTDSRLTTGDNYPLEARQELTMIDAPAIAAAMQSADASATAMKVMMKLLPLGKEASEHTLLVSGMPIGRKMSSRPWEEAEVIERLSAAINNAQTLLASVATTPGGIIVLKEPAAGSAAAAPADAPVVAAAASGATAAIGGGGSGSAPLPTVGGSYDEFSPFQMAQHAHRSLLSFGSFSEAVDDFFSRLEVSPHTRPHRPLVPPLATALGHRPPLATALGHRPLVPPLPPLVARGPPTLPHLPWRHASGVQGGGGARPPGAAGVEEG